MRDAFAKLCLRVLHPIAVLERDIVSKEREERLAAIAKANYPSNPDIGKEPKYTHVSAALSINFIDYLISIVSVPPKQTFPFLFLTYTLTLFSV